MSEDRRYLSDDADIDRHDYELVIHDARDRNGDWYISIVPKGHKIGPTVRIRTSGGEASRLPGFIAAIDAMYQALARDPRADRLHAVLESAVDLDLLVLRSGDYPEMGKSGVRYAPNLGAETMDVLDRVVARGTGDADALAVWRVAELRRIGVDATFVVRSEPLPSSFGTYLRIYVRHPDGTIEDPTLPLCPHHVAMTRERCAVCADPSKGNV